LQKKSNNYFHKAGHCNQVDNDHTDSGCLHRLVAAGPLCLVGGAEIDELTEADDRL
jgi:hypothetical protein